MTPQEVRIQIESLAKQAAAKAKQVQGLMNQILAITPEITTFIERKLSVLSVSPSSVPVPLLPGQTQQFTASGVWSDGTTGTPVTTWTCTGGTITPAGLFTAGNVAGQFAVTAAAEGRTTSVAVPVELPAATLVSLTVSPASAAVQADASQTFTVTAKWSDGSTIVPTITWMATGGTITNTGVYRAGSVVGSYQVKAINGAISGTAEVTITASPSPTTLTLRVVGDPTTGPYSVEALTNATQDVRVEFTVDGVPQITENVEPYFVFGNDTALNPVLRALGPGSHVFVARLYEQAGTAVLAEAQLTVVEPAPAVTLTSLTIAPTNASVVAGATQQFTASALWSDGSTALPALTWAATGGTVSTSGLFTAGAASGAASVTVAGGGKTATAAVTVTTTPPVDDGVVLYRDTYTNGRHSPALPAAPGFVYEAMAGTFIFTKDEFGRDVFRLLVPADGDDNRNEQRFHGFGRHAELFVGFKRRCSPNFTHEKIGTSATNFKQLRLFTEDYGKGAHLGYSILAGATPGGFGQILFEGSANGGESFSNKGTWDRVALAGVDERWGFYVKLASGPGVKDGILRFWYQGVDLMKKQMDAAIAAGKVPFDWNHVDLWDYEDGLNYLSNGFYPGWDNSGSTNEEYIDYHEFVLATKPLAEYITP